MDNLSLGMEFHFCVIVNLMIIINFWAASTCTCIAFATTIGIYYMPMATAIDELLLACVCTCILIKLLYISLVNFSSQIEQPWRDSIFLHSKSKDCSDSCTKPHLYRVRNRLLSMSRRSNQYYKSLRKL